MPSDQLDVYDGALITAESSSASAAFFFFFFAKSQFQKFVQMFKITTSPAVSSCPRPVLVDRRDRDVDLLVLGFKAVPLIVLFKR